MTKKNTITYDPVDSSPVKSFFVSNLTRDIKLEEAILDLLDNCVDGILRTKSQLSGTHPYKGFKADIEFSKDSFTITDNCGGIPWELHDYAFRMGRASDRPDDAPGTVGVYGIGMKRAMFKMGRHCRITTQHDDRRYQVEYSPDWIDREDEWEVPVKSVPKPMKDDGTQITITDLHAGIADRFHADREDFETLLYTMIATHYAFIIDKGFRVKMNGREVKPRPTRLIFVRKPSRRGQVIRPFIFEATVDKVEVFLAVGFTRPIPSSNDVDDATEGKKYSAIDAGWTVVCNDRAVLYCDRTELTGWGEASVPRFHNQFIAIAGIVEFRADNAALLPTTTTKRGIEASSSLYLRVKNKMREGMLIFTDYTNKWKGREDEAKEHMDAGEALSVEEIKLTTRRELTLNKTRQSVLPGRQYKPTLPLPTTIDPRTRRISFTKEIRHIRTVGEYLFNDADTDPASIGAKCFDLTLRDARK